MLAYLDTLSGFAVIMLVASLVITILTQIVSTLLSHRGANLLWGLRTLFEQVDPASLSNLKAQANAVAEAVLTHPMASDSVFSKFQGAWAKRFRLATAIRSDELVNILNFLADHPPAGWNAAVIGEIRTLLMTPNLTMARQLDLVRRLT